MNNFERRDSRDYAECRVESSDSGRKIRGFAIVFDVLSVDLGGFREKIAPEAVDRTIQKALDVRALVDHDSGKIIGRTRSGTLRLRKESKGLKVEIEPDEEITYARDVMIAVRRGDISGMSFGFRVLEDSWEYDSKEAQSYNVPIRTVHDMVVSEVSIVGAPAYQSTSVEVALRSLQAFQQTQQGNRVAFLARQMRNLRARG